jgi:ubiquinone/menaquinone biosynthesis C-methylase UbiE
MAVDFTEVTELAGAEISGEQLQRMVHRYRWAANHCTGKDVVEVACGSGQGLGMLGAVAKTLEAGDYSKEVLAVPRAHYRNRYRLAEFDAQTLPYADRSKDAIVMFEAIYYVPDAARFAAECKRVLRPGGQVLVATANKDLSDFNPSPYSHRYYGVVELEALFKSVGFETEQYGYLPVGTVSWRQRALRPIKQLVVGLGLMPKTMRGKKLLKRLVFGKLEPMPAELEPVAGELEPPARLPSGVPDHTHKVLYCRATLPV